MPGRGGGQVVSVLAFYSDDLSSDPLKPTVFSVTFMIEKRENKQKDLPQKVELNKD